MALHAPCTRLEQMLVTSKTCDNPQFSVPPIVLKFPLIQEWVEEVDKGDAGDVEARVKALIPLM